MQHQGRGGMGPNRFPVIKQTGSTYCRYNIHVDHKLVVRRPIVVDECWLEGFKQRVRGSNIEVQNNGVST